MRRRSRSRDSSLELLLDTITNTFGGILFIAILVSLMLQTTSRQILQEAAGHEPMPPLEQARLEIRIDELRGEAEAFGKRIAAAAQDRRAGGDTAPLQEFEAATAALQAALDDRAKAAAGILELQRQAAEYREKLATLEQQRASADTRFAAAERQLTAARTEAAALAAAVLALEQVAAAVVERTVSLPNLRPSAKDEVGLYLRFDRLFQMHAWQDGRRMGPNADQFVIVPIEGEDGVRQVARPKPTAGLPVTAGTVRDALPQLLRPFPPGRFVVSLIVFDDSFDVFQLVKGAIVDAGYEYRPIPLQAGQSVVDFGGVGEAQ